MGRSRGSAAADRGAERQSPCDRALSLVYMQRSQQTVMKALRGTLSYFHSSLHCRPAAVLRLAIDKFLLKCNAAARPNVLTP